MKIFALICLLLPFGLGQEHLTSNSESSDYRLYAAQTTYFLNADLDTSPVSVPGCKPAYFWFLARHGTRCPKKEDIQAMAETLPELRERIVAAWMSGNGQLGDDTVNMFKNWKLSITTEDEMSLTESGGREHEEMGARWEKRLDSLLNVTDQVLVHASKTERTRESAKYFLKGVFKADIEVPPSPEIEDDLLLRFMTNCPKWMEGVYRNPESYAQVNKLEGSKDYRLMLKDVGERAGLTVTHSEVKLAWNMCRYEMAWSPDTASPWCELYSAANLRMMEFREDLAYYYLNGYGNDVNLKMTQPVFEDIFQRFEENKEGRSKYTAALHFAHEVTVLPVLAALGLHHDDAHLVASDWPQSQDYLWRTSFLASFAANLGLVLLECDAEEEEARWKVMAMAQEKRVILPACGEEVCTLDQFNNFYKHWTQLDFEAFCKFDGHGLYQPPSFWP